jgi:hypothetical protein
MNSPVRGDRERAVGPNKKHSALPESTSLEAVDEIAALCLVGPQHAPDDSFVHEECGWKRGYGLGPGLSRGARRERFAETQLTTAGLSWKRFVMLLRQELAHGRIAPSLPERLPRRAPLEVVYPAPLTSVLDGLGLLYPSHTRLTNDAAARHCFLEGWVGRERLSLLLGWGEVAWFGWTASASS